MWSKLSTVNIDSTVGWFLDSYTWTINGSDDLELESFMVWFFPQLCGEEPSTVQRAPCSHTRFPSTDLALSHHRATALASFLVPCHISWQHVHSISFGHRDPKTKCINLLTPSFSFSSHFLPLFFKCFWLVASNLTFTCVCVDKTLHGTGSKFLIQKKWRWWSQIQWQLKITIVTIVSISQQMSNSSVMCPTMRG